MDKRMICLLYAITMSMGLCLSLFATEKNILCSIKPLDLTINFADLKDGWQNDFVAAVQENIKYFSLARQKKLAECVCFFKIEHIDAILEWGGGLQKRYFIYILSANNLHWISWCGDNVAMGRIQINNYQYSELKRRVQKLSSFKGGIFTWAADRIIFYMTFYKNGIPKRTFYSDLPGEYFTKESDDTGYHELGLLLQEIEKMAKHLMP